MPREKKTHDRPNRASPSEAASFVEEIDRSEQDYESRADQLDAEFKQKKRALRKAVQSDIDAVLSEAKKQGVKKGVVRAIVDGQKRLRAAQEKLSSAKEKASDGIHKLDQEEQDFAVDIVKALGDDFAGFGLGAAAVEREEAKPNGRRKKPDTAGIVAEANKAWSEADSAAQTITN